MFESSSPSDVSSSLGEMIKLAIFFAIFFVLDAKNEYLYVGHKYKLFQARLFRPKYNVKIKIFT